MAKHRCYSIDFKRQVALEIESLKGALKNAPRPRNGTPSVITGPAFSPSVTDAV